MGAVDECKRRIHLRESRAATVATAAVVVAMQGLITSRRSIGMPCTFLFRRDKITYKVVAQHEAK